MAARLSSSSSSRRLSDYVPSTRAEELLTGHRRILELVAKQASLFTILHELVSFLEDQYDGLLCSILLVDTASQTFKVGVKACESKNFSREEAGVSILPPYVGPCCMASHLGEHVVSEHIATDDRWQEPWKSWAVGQGLQSCRSQPIIASTGHVLGAFAMYHKESRDPTAERLHQLELATLVAGIAIERKQIESNARRQLEQQQRLNEDLSHALDLRDEFLSLASHELRNPLNTLKLQNRLYQDRLDSGEHPSDQELRKMLTVGDRQVSRLVRYVETLLDASRFQPGKISLKYEPCDLAQLVADASEQLEPLAERAGCSVELRLPSDARGTWDPFRLGQVITNLLDNAIKYAPRGTIVVEVHDRETSVELSVRDSGMGIDPHFKDKIFERYERADQTRGGVFGLGLGLYIVKEIVDAHHGTIEIESAPGQGAKFILAFPKVP